MKRISILLILCLFFGSVMAGCGTLDNTSQRSRRIRQVWASDLRQLQDDWDQLILVDHGSRMSKYHTEVGE